MKRTLLACITLSLLAACKPAAPPPSTAAAPDPAMNAAFAALSQRAVASWLARSPVFATQMGEHRYDSELDDYSAEGRQEALSDAQTMLTELGTLDRSKLSRDNQVDAAILANELQYRVWREQSLQDWAWDPQVYNDLAGNAVYSLMAREFAPLPQRLQSAIARMEKLPTLLAQARANLDPARVPKIHAETVARQNAGILGIVTEFITPHAKELSAADQKRLAAATVALKKAVQEQQRWLDKTLVPNARGDFRLGAALYDQKLKFALLSSLSRAEIKQRAEAEITRVRGDMYGIARGLLKDKAPALPDAPTPEQQQAAIEAALELAYADRPARDKVVEAATAALQSATDFARSKDLLTLPDSPVKIILMPEFQRGVTVAYSDSPGPMDRNLTALYAVSPIPADWGKAQVDSYLREYNNRQIHLLSIHEGLPGHYLEGWHSAKNPSMLRAVLRSGLFAEGWAVYTEHMMQEQGYLDGDPLFHLVQLKFYLRTVANAILDQGVHVDGWTREQAMDLMVKQTFQQQSEAAGKWVRVQLTSAQLPTYFVGVQEFLDLRAAEQKKLGDRFNLRAYHDQVLSYGAPPVRFAREMMLDEPIG
ncbi:MAG: DUF885 domain-containing protein [Pseudomonadota bacterium]